MGGRMSGVAVIVFCAAVSLAATDGWENVNPARKPSPMPGEIAWTADLSRLSDFSLEKRAGAEGTFTVVGGQIKIVKTNGRGFLLLKAKPFAVDTNRTMRVFADVRAEGATPEFCHGMLRAYGKKELLAIQKEALAEEGGSAGGRQMMMGLVNMPEGMFYRKYVHYRSEDGVFTPVIVIVGEPSTSFWKNWTVEDHASAMTMWAGVVAESERRRRGAAAPISLADMKSRLEKDVEHTAKVIRDDGCTRFVVDGHEDLPVAYRGVEHQNDFTDMGAFEPIQGKGVRIVIPSLYVNKYKWNIAWDRERGFDAQKVVAEFAETMRAEPNALFMPGFFCNAYPEFVDDHPGEGWVNEDGKQIYGSFFASRYDGSRPEGSWAWPSYASMSWRRAVCDNIRAFVAELKRQGLQKRVIGIHICGYGDGQFTSNPTDCSTAAKEEYARYLAEGNCYSTNYTYFTRQLPQRAIDEFARAFKVAMGKDVVAIRWCSAPFVVSHDIEAFCRSRWTDIMVPQPNYSDRAPALGCTLYPPLDTIRRYGKMVWSELDHRTWWVVNGRYQMSVLQTCPAEDIRSWCTGYRKLAGQMVAARQGFWFYDMQRGSFASPDIADDIGRSLDTMRKLSARPTSPWRPTVALVIDNTGFIGWDGGERPYPGHTYFLSQNQMRLMSESGVPYEMLLAEDALEHPELLDGMKTIVFMLWRKFDEKRIALVRRLAGEGRSLVFLAESGMCGGVREATGFDVEFIRDKLQSFRVLPEPGVKELTLGAADVDEVRSQYRSFGRDPANPLRSPVGDRRGNVAEEPGIKVLGRFEDDKSAAIAMREDGNCRRYYFSAPGGLSPDMFNRIARESGAYVPVDKARLQVFMNGDFISVHALDNGRFAFKLPFDCKVVNEKTGREEPTTDGILPLDLTAGETCWFTLERKFYHEK